MTARRYAMPRGQYTNQEQVLAQCSHLIIAGELAAGVSHKIANVLMGASATFELLQLRITAGQRLDDLAEVLTNAYDNVIDGARILRRLQSISSSHHSVVSRVSPRDIIESAVEMCALHPLARQVRVVNDASGGELVAEGDAVVLEEVTISLILDALRASEPGTTIRVGAEESDQGGRVGIFVVAEGCEVKALDEDGLFRSPRKKPEGSRCTGAALLSSLERLRQINAEIVAVGESGKGATVVVKLPKWSGPRKRGRIEQ